MFFSWQGGDKFRKALYSGILRSFLLTAFRNSEFTYGLPRPVFHLSAILKTGARGFPRESANYSEA